MTTPEVKNLIAAHIEYMDASGDDKLAFIDDAIDYLSFLKRFVQLEPHEKEAFEASASKLKDAKGPYFDEGTRANFQTHAQWLAYLHGDKNELKPAVALPPTTGDGAAASSQS